MKNFIVPVDFSPAGMNAAFYAINFAAATGAAITLLHVCQTHVSTSEIPVPDMIVEDIESKAAQEMKQLEDELLAKISTPVKVDTQITEGDFIVALMKIVKEMEPDGVIMGTHGKGNLETLMFGSNTLTAAKNLSCPLLVIPSGAKFQPVNNIGMACDFRDVMHTIPADTIKSFIQLLSGRLHILHVSSVKENMLTAAEIKESAWISKAFEEVNPEFHAIYDEHIEKGLSSYVLSHDIDMLMIIPKKHSFADSLLHKTHLKDFIANAQVPLVSIHA